MYQIPPDGLSEFCDFTYHLVFGIIAVAFFPNAAASCDLITFPRPASSNVNSLINSGNSDDLGGFLLESRLPRSPEAFGCLGSVLLHTQGQ